ncbi:NUDIX domain-containing protein [Fusibacter paucivorans]|uniref:NUDIX domain-containing protein n=1 Tax=Fusibacter paucivorans TaxID=76009 RepID=A0ABS5PRY5_9FIRM|nr:NUDIX domain-containing protein [Fusibacter paucivorans]MBS7527925.1 NUDIX domain-containing protein [Fusibacter paucivorans]
MKIDFYDWELADRVPLKYAVMIARYKRQLLFVKHRERTSWEVPGGHREEGEHILAAANRELIEETAANAFQMIPICVYSVERESSLSYGGLFFADIFEMNDTLQYEIETVKGFDTLPERLTYPAIQPRLLEEVLKQRKKVLMQESNLPGPRGNLKRLDTFIDYATEMERQMCLDASTLAEDANNPETFVLMCGVAASIAHNRSEQTALAMHYAEHPSWRVREGVCIGFQKASVGMKPSELLSAMTPLKTGSPFQQRAYVAGLCEPALLKDYIDAAIVLDSLYEITMTVFDTANKLTEAQTALRKALGYGWSVAIVALPDYGMKRFESLVDNGKSKHIKWIVRNNLKKNRLVRMDADWVAKMIQCL